jgi:hypothetical protein
MMPCGDLNYVLRVCSSTGSMEILWSDTQTGVGRPHRMVGASVSHIIDLTGLRRFSVLFLLCSCSSPRAHRFSLNHRCKTLRANCKYHLIQPSQPPLSHLFLPPSTFGPRRSRLVTCNNNTPLTLSRTLSLVNNNFQQFSVRTAQY